MRANTYIIGEIQGLLWALELTTNARIGNHAKEIESRTSAMTADSISGREIDLEYAVSFGMRANGDDALCKAISQRIKEIRDKHNIAEMKSWHGGDAPPEDWDGGPVLRRHGEMSMPDGPFAWQNKDGGLGNIVAYKTS